MLDKSKRILHKDSHKWDDQHQSERDSLTSLQDRRLIENPNRKTEGSGLKGMMNNLPAKAGG